MSFRSTVKAPPLSEEQLTVAVDALSSSLFPAVNRNFIDPAEPGPRFALFSFIPAVGATADDAGIYGYAKIRGAYDTSEEAFDRSESIIRCIDSTNSVFTTKIGHPFPVCTRGMAKDIKKVDVSERTGEAISKNVRAKRDAEQAEMRTMKDRENELKEDVSTEDPLQDYCTLRVKYATFKYEVERYRKQIADYVRLQRKCGSEIMALDECHHDFHCRYVERYYAGRRSAGLSATENLPAFLSHLDIDVKKDLELLLLDADEEPAPP